MSSIIDGTFYLYNVSLCVCVFTSYITKFPITMRQILTLCHILSIINFSRRNFDLLINSPSEKYFHTEV